jgi:hypothetical protein
MPRDMTTLQLEGFLPNGEKAQAFPALTLS